MKLICFSKVEWLDRLTFREIAMINDKEKKTSEYIFLLIEFQTVVVGDRTVRWLTF